MHSTQYSEATLAPCVRDMADHARVVMLDDDWVLHDKYAEGGALDAIKALLLADTGWGTGSANASEAADEQEVEE